MRTILQSLISRASARETRPIVANGSTDIKDYWATRRNHDLYRLTLLLARTLFFDAKSAIDVGCYTSGLICEMDWISGRVATDLQKRLTENWKDVRDVEFVAG